MPGHVYFGPEPSFQQSTLPNLTPEQWQDFDERAKAFEKDLSLLSQQHGVVFGETDYGQNGLYDTKDDRLRRVDLQWSDDTQAYKWWE